MLIVLTQDLLERIVNKIKDVHLLYHETTFAELTDRVEKTGHSTTLQAERLRKAM